MRLFQVFHPRSTHVSILVSVVVAAFAITVSALALGQRPPAVQPAAALSQVQPFIPEDTKPLDYIVQPGDTLSSIAKRVTGSADWAWLYDANRSRIRYPGSIYPGQVLIIPANRSATPLPAPNGTLGCAGLETLWERAGGSQSRARLAASIAMAESSGRQYATGAAGERGYWQINPVHGPLSSYDPIGNARAAVILSADGTDWSAWTTYVSGEYQGRC